MPLQFPQPEHPIVTFARELDALLQHHEPKLTAAEIAMVLSSNATGYVGVNVEPKVVSELKESFHLLAKLKMAKAHLER
jgi:hypothetical protein